jgi:hypothetical protein
VAPDCHTCAETWLSPCLPFDVGPNSRAVEGSPAGRSPQDDLRVSRRARFAQHDPFRDREHRNRPECWSCHWRRTWCAVKTKLVGCASPPMPACPLCNATPAAKPQVPPQVYAHTVLVTWGSPLPRKVTAGRMPAVRVQYRLYDVAPRDNRCRLSGASEWGHGACSGGR